MSSDAKGMDRRTLLKLGLGAGALGIAGRSPVAAEDKAADKDAAADTLPQVPRRRLGKTGETVPILLMGGAMNLDTRFDPKLGEALRFGVNYFDAADWNEYIPPPLRDELLCLDCYSLIKEWVWMGRRRA